MSGQKKPRPKPKPFAGARRRGCIQTSLISKTPKAHENIPYAPTIPKSLISGAHAPWFRVFEPILQLLFKYFRVQKIPNGQN